MLFIPFSLGVGDKSHNAVYSLGAYYDLGCWQDRGGSARTMTLLKLRPKRIDWVNLITNMENTSLHQFMHSIFFRKLT